jgi:putative membrane protein
MVTLSQDRLLITVGIIALAIMIVTVIGGIEFLPILILLALSIPVVFYLVNTEPDSEPDDDTMLEDTSNPIDELRRQFATGRMDNEEFERRLDVLLETENIEDRTPNHDLIHEQN